LREVPWTAIVIAAAVLLLGAGVLVFNGIPRATPDEDDWYVKVSGRVEAGGDLSIDDMRAISEVAIRMALLGTNEDGSEHAYKGIALGTLLGRCQVIEGASGVTVRATDAYSTRFDMETAVGEGIFLVWEKDGKALEGRSDGGAGPVRLLVSQGIAGEFNAQRCVKYVSEVVVS
jgi:DMSO/TMAO reductase YedYZ molybdopterin-dependent catalytic subunit